MNGQNIVIREPQDFDNFFDGVVRRLPDETQAFVRENCSTGGVDVLTPRALRCSRVIGGHSRSGSRYAGVQTESIT